MKTLSFIIPCYCSEKSIGGVIDEIIQTVTNDGRYDYEIICINDGSTDKSLEIINVQTSPIRMKTKGSISLSKDNPFNPPIEK